MKNHPVNNDYVQNLVEGLVSEAKQTVYQSKNKPENRSYLTKDVKLDKFPIERKKDERGKDEKEKVDENAEAGYPALGIKGGTAAAKATQEKLKKKKPPTTDTIDEDIDSRILKKIEDAGGGKEYEKKRSEYSKKVGDKIRKSSEEK